MRTPGIKTSLLALAFTCIFLLLSAPAFALCPNCYSSAIGDKGISALKSGILILLIPTMILFGGLFWITFKRRNPYYPEPGAFAESGRENSTDGLIPIAAPEADRG